MANLLGQNIGTNYKGILSLDSTINTPLDATLRAVTDGEGNASGLKLSTSDSSFNGKLGIGTDTPTQTLQVKTANTGDVDLVNFTNGNNINTARFKANGGFLLGAATDFVLIPNIGTTTRYSAAIGSLSSPTARLQVKGSGTTSATTALLVQNSAGTDILKITDDTFVTFSGNVKSSRNYVDLSINYSSGSNTTIIPSALGWSIQYAGATSNIQIGRTGFLGSKEASASLQVDATTQGFLPPRMTTTQKNAIAAPASGLVVYDSTTNKLACYNGTTWNDLF